MHVAVDVYAEIDAKKKEKADAHLFLCALYPLNSPPFLYACQNTLISSLRCLQVLIAFSAFSAPALGATNEMHKAEAQDACLFSFFYVFLASPFSFIPVLLPLAVKWRKEGRLIPFILSNPNSLKIPFFLLYFLVVESTKQLLLRDSFLPF